MFAIDNWLLCDLVSGVSEYIQPFSQPNVDRFTGSLPANQMTEDEKANFPQFARYFLSLFDHVLFLLYLLL